MSDQPSRPADLLFDVFHQEAEDALVLLSSLVNSTWRELKHTSEELRHSHPDVVYSVLMSQDYKHGWVLNLSAASGQAVNSLKHHIVHFIIYFP